MSHDCNIICLDCFNKRYNLEFQQMSSICINKMFRETKYILYLQFVCFPVHYWKLETLSKYLECKIATGSQTHNWKLISIEIKLGWMDDDVKVVMPLCSLKVWVNLNCTDDPISALYCCALNILLHHHSIQSGRSNLTFNYNTKFIWIQSSRQTMGKRHMVSQFPSKCNIQWISFIPCNL